MAGRSRFWRLTAVGVVAAVMLAACGSDDDDGTVASGDGDTGADTEKTVTIAFLGALTGDSANLGINARDAVQLAIDEANAKGDGITIALKEFDTAGDPAQATTIKDQVVGDDSIVAVVGPVFSGETKAVLPTFEDAGLAMISPGATNAALPDIVANSKVFHRVIADDVLQSSGIVSYIVDTAKPTKVAYIHDNSEYGKGLTDDVAKQASAKGITSVLSDTVDPDAEDFSATVNKVTAAAPDLVFYGGYYAEAGRFKKQLDDAGSKATFLSGDGSLDPGFITAAGPASAEGARLSCPCNLAFETSTGDLKAFYDNHKAKVGREPGLYSPEGYDAANLLIEGIKKGNAQRASLLSYLEEDFTSFKGVSKTVEFAPNGNVTSKDFFVFVVKDGKLAPLETVTVG